MPYVQVSELFDLLENFVDFYTHRIRWPGNPYRYFVNNLGERYGYNWALVYAGGDTPYLPMFLYPSSGAGFVIARPMSSFITRPQQEFYRTVLDQIPDSRRIEYTDGRDEQYEAMERWLELVGSLPGETLGCVRQFNTNLPTHWNNQGQRLEHYNGATHWSVWNLNRAAYEIHVPMNVCGRANRDRIRIESTRIFRHNGISNYAMSMNMPDLFSAITRLYGVQRMRTSKAIEVTDESTEEPPAPTVNYQSIWSEILARQPVGEPTTRQRSRARFADTYNLVWNT